MWTGEIVTKEALGIVPYYMWNLADGKYCNVYYGANFVDYIGKVDSYIAMVRPSNGQYYDTFIYGNYFKATYDGDVAADDTTLAAIAAINKLVEITQNGGMIKPEHESLVVAARQAYDKIATKEQQALVTNLTALLSAEDRIASFKDTEPEPDPIPPVVEEPEDQTTTLVVVVVIESILLGAIALCVALWFFLKKRGAKKQDQTEQEGSEDAKESDASEDTESDQTSETEKNEEEQA